MITPQNHLGYEDLMHFVRPIGKTDRARTGIGISEAEIVRNASAAVIGMCNAWGEFIVRNPDMDLFQIIQNCADLLINGFVDNVDNRKMGMEL